MPLIHVHTRISQYCKRGFPLCDCRSYDRKMANELNVGDMKKALTEVVTDPKSRKVYEVGKPYNEGWLKVSALHEIHFFEMGKQDGKPVIYL